MALAFKQSDSFSNGVFTIKVNEDHDPKNPIYKIELSDDSPDFNLQFIAFQNYSDNIDIDEDGNVYIVDIDKLDAYAEDATTEFSFRVSVEHTRHDGTIEYLDSLPSLVTVQEVDEAPELTLTAKETPATEHTFQTLAKVTTSDDDGDDVVVKVVGDYAEFFTVNSRGNLVAKRKKTFEFDDIPSAEIETESGLQKTFTVKLLARSTRYGEQPKFTEASVEVTIADDGRQTVKLDLEDITYDGKLTIQKGDEVGTVFGTVDVRNFDSDDNVRFEIWEGGKNVASEYFGVDDDDQLYLKATLPDKKANKTFNLTINALVDGVPQTSKSITLHVNDIGFDGSDEGVRLDDIAIKTNKDQSVTFDFKNDTTNSDEPLFAAETSGRQDTDMGGEFSVDEFGNITYKPPKDHIGEDTFAISLTDRRGGFHRDVQVTVDVQEPVDEGEKVNAREYSMRLFGSKVTLHDKLLRDEFDLHASNDSGALGEKVNADGELEVIGDYGSLFIKYDGSWRFVVDNSPDNEAVEELNGKKDADGNALSFETQKFFVRYKHKTEADQTFKIDLKIQIDGSTDYYASNPERVIFRDSDEDLTLHSSSEANSPYWTYLYGGNGNDVLKGSDGVDYLYGGAGNDELYGGAGDDTLWGHEGNDELYGGSGHDYLNGGAGDDEMYGGAGSDFLNDGAGNDILDGGAGNDRFFGGRGNDILDGGDGDDTFVGLYDNPIGSVIADATDSARWRQNSDGTWEKGTGQGYIWQRFWADLDGDKKGRDEFDPDDEYDYFTNIEYFSLAGGAGNDVLISKGGDGGFSAGGGDDLIDGGVGWKNQLTGRTGSDDFVLDLSGLGRDFIEDFTFGGKSGSSRFDAETQADEKDQIAIRFSAADMKAIEDAANPLDMLKEKAGIEFKKVKDSRDSRYDDTIIYKTADNVELMEIRDFTTPLTFEMFALLPLETEVA